MAEISIRTEDLTHVASSMKNWSNSMKAIASEMRTKVNSMKDWSDARAEQFREQANMTANQLDIHIDTFIKMAQFLNKYAQMQQEAARAQNARMSGM